MKKDAQKINKYAQFTEPQAEFDYHGLDSFLGEGGIEAVTREQIQQFRKKGKMVVRLIVGKGLHSQNGPVIKPIVLNLLQKMKLQGEIQSYTFDSAFGTGPNAGAVVVKL